MDIDDVLSDWAYSPSDLMTRLVRASDGRYVLQMRIDMGLMQMEVKYRPDGTTPFGFKTYLAYLKHLAAKMKGCFVLESEYIDEAIRELKQFNNRRICWLRLQRYSAVIRDADHCISLMNFIQHRLDSQSPVVFTEMDRILVLLHRTQAATMVVLREHGPLQAIEEVASGIRRMMELSVVSSENTVITEEVNEQIEPILGELLNLKQWIQDHYGLAPSLDERLQNAVIDEKYELAAELRDLIGRYKKGGKYQDSSAIGGGMTVREENANKLERETKIYRKRGE